MRRRRARYPAGWAHAEGQGIPGLAQEGWNGLLEAIQYRGLDRSPESIGETFVQ